PGSPQTAAPLVTAPRGRRPTTSWTPRLSTMIGRTSEPERFARAGDRHRQTAYRSRDWRNPRTGDRAGPWWAGPGSRGRYVGRSHRTEIHPAARQGGVR